MLVRSGGAYGESRYYSLKTGDSNFLEMYEDHNGVVGLYDYQGRSQQTEWHLGHPLYSLRLV